MRLPVLRTALSRSSLIALLVLLFASAAPRVARGEEPKAPAAAPLPPRTALDRYVEKDDPSYGWKVVGEEDTAGGGRSHVLELTSQRWRSEDEVDRPVWKHWLVIARPKTIRANTALLLVGGGRNGRDAPEGASERLAGMSALLGAVLVELRMVPNQPLRFAGDDRPRWEDDLIAYTWNRYLDSGDPTWLARMPMVKSAVRAMDAVQEFVATPAGGGHELNRFVVAGGSKRGWTTWLTGAVDRRVSAVVPIVIDLVNVVPSMEHHYAAYGFWAPAVGDYERNGIMDRRLEPEYADLIRLVDPYYYRHRLRMPKYIVNSAGDEFFLPDSWKFYFDELAGEKHLRYVPNTDHSLSGSDAYESLAAFFGLVASGVPRPRYSWSIGHGGSIRVESTDRPSEVLLWKATNPESRDFRLEEIGRAWSSQALAPRAAREGEGDGDGDGDGKAPLVYEARLDPPEKGWTAFFIELSYDVPGNHALKLTSGVSVVPDDLPHDGKLERAGETSPSR